MYLFKSIYPSIHSPGLQSKVCIFGAYLAYFGVDCSVGFNQEPSDLLFT